MFLDSQTQNQNFVPHQFIFSCQIKVSAVPFGRTIDIHHSPLANFIRQTFFEMYRRENITSLLAGDNGPSPEIHRL